MYFVLIVVLKVFICLKQLSVFKIIINNKKRIFNQLSRVYIDK